MDMPVNVPVDNPNADTEWNDILRSKGIIPQKPPDPEPLIQEALIEAEKRAHENRLEDKDIDELDALEDDEDEEFLAQYRNKRLAELTALQNASVYGQVFPLQKRDYTRDVTEASKKAFVLVNLTSSLGSNVESAVLSQLWRQASLKYGDIKFCEAKADMCIEGYPERNCPTILVYKDGDIKKQILTLRELNGVKTNLRDLERVLVECTDRSEAAQ
ncbi:hypothetical protein DV738_g219, partial [Chaetothyriales sp. CBS 135597]